MTLKTLKNRFMSNDFSDSRNTYKIKRTRATVYFILLFLTHDYKRLGTSSSENAVIIIATIQANVLE